MWLHKSTPFLKNFDLVFKDQWDEKKSLDFSHWILKRLTNLPLQKTSFKSYLWYNENVISLRLQKSLETVCVWRYFGFLFLFEIFFQSDLYRFTKSDSILFRIRVYPVNQVLVKTDRFYNYIWIFHFRSAFSWHVPPFPVFGTFILNALRLIVKKKYYVFLLFSLPLW